VGLLIVFQVSATGKKKKPSCDSDSYSSEVIESEPISETCTRYTIEVSYDGTRTHGLSHYSIALPCGEIKDATNSKGYKMEFGKDRKTGVYGLKIDGIWGFGERDADSFTVSFTWCASSCEKEIGVVAYKFGQCVSYDTLTNNEPPPTTGETCSTLLASLQKQNESCPGTGDGSLEVLVQSGEEPFSYAWSNGSGNSTIEGISAGMYAVTITDALGNTLTINEEISALAPLAITEVVTNPACNGQFNGAIDLSVAGGSGTYSFSWSWGLTGTATTEDLSNLASGFYSITVTDDAGCSANKTIVLSNTSVVSAEPVLVNPTCEQQNGSITLTPVGGIAPYSYRWTTGETTKDRQNLGAGSYVVQITDASGCSVFKSYTLEKRSTLILQYTVTPTSCSGDNSGAVTLTIFGGTQPYNIVWDDDASAGLVRTGLSTGSYHVKVTEAAGCVAEANISVNNETLQVSSTITQPTCATDLGSITVIPDGQGPYDYEWIYAGDGPKDGSTLENLPPGNYLVNITDAAGCKQTQSFFIVAPTAIVATGVISNTQCDADNAYAINLSVSGGKAPYSYLWSNNATTEDVSGLSPGGYAVEITDALGCVAEKEFVITPAEIIWSCLINLPAASPVCSSVGNMLSTDAVEGAVYQWSVASSDNTWVITSGTSSAAVVYTAGATGSTATFTLSLLKDGCTKTCSFVVENGCVERDNTGGGDPSSDDPCVPTSETPPVAEVVPEVPAEPEQPGNPTDAEVDEDDGDETEVCVVHPYPNPFKDWIKFEWTATKDEKVKLEIYDSNGSRECVVYDGPVKRGKRYSVDWDGRNMKDGLHYCRMATSSGVRYKKIMKFR
jgi:hypothetical protein